MGLACEQSTRKGERGNVMIMTAIFSVGLVLAVGLSIDVSRIYMVRSGLQNAADAAALAAARELNSGTGGLADAVAQAKAVALEANKYGFNRTGVTAPNVTISKVEFSASLASNATWYNNTTSNTVPAGTETSIRYVRVTTQAASVSVLFAVKALGATHVEQRTAVAGASVGLNTICDYVPLAVGKTDPTTRFATGTPLTLQYISADATSISNQDVIVLQTNNSESANKTVQATAGTIPRCTPIGASLQTSSSQSAQGNNGPTQIEVGLNTRFDLYSRGLTASEAPPDTNICQDPTCANFGWVNYRSQSPTSSPSHPGVPDRRILVLPIVYTGAISGSVRVGGFGAFLLLKQVTNPNNPSSCNQIPSPCGHVQVEQIGDDFLVGRGFFDPNNGPPTLLSIPVLYR
jgi:Flp pilus assembly protein TadG